MNAPSCSAFAPTVRPTRRSGLGGLITILEGWAERRWQRRALLGLNDHALKDIGLSSADAWQESHKPFWRP